ncbi:alpha/beta fold hydrolase [Brachybacterium sp.]|uniref:alpha/beta fold hydrolase n=4 Tax=Brachybacterium TaxID=43668 RepID=UPI003F9451D9
MRNEISFTTSADGTSIAWSRHGEGPPLVRAGTWLTHLEYDWSSPVWNHWLLALGQRFSVIRYDARGNGLSDRNPVDYSLAALLADLEAVVDAARLPSFALFGMSQGGAVAVEYARRHPERVTHLILLGAYGRGIVARNPGAAILEEMELELQMIKVGWGRADPIYRRVITSSFIPGASETQMRWFDDLERRSMTPEAAVASSIGRANVDVSASARAVTAPTLVLHADGDRSVPFEEGRRLAGLIPGARLVSLHGKNHILLADEPAWDEFIDEVTAFAGAAPVKPPSASLTSRELEVLRLVAQGMSNDECSSRLSMSTRTVERHLSNVYAKLSLTGKSARAAAAARLTELERGALDE